MVPKIYGSIHADTIADHRSAKSAGRYFEFHLPIRIDICMQIYMIHQIMAISIKNLHPTIIKMKL